MHSVDACMVVTDQMRVQVYEQVSEECAPNLCPAPGHEELLQRVWSYVPLLPEWDIKASINSAGLLQRMRLAVAKMLKGVHCTNRTTGGGGESRPYAVTYYWGWQELRCDCPSHCSGKEHIARNTRNLLQSEHTSCY